MPDVALLDLVDRVRQALRTREDLFEIVLDRQAPPATPEEVAAAEAALGHALPEILRDFYRQAGALFFEWEIRPGRFRDLGYKFGVGTGGKDEVHDGGQGQAPRGILRIPALEALARRGEDIAQITVSNGAGDGWALVRTPDGSTLQVIWFDHERPESRNDPHDTTVPAVFADLAAIGFACDGDTGGIERFLRPQKAKKATKAKKKKK